MSRKELSMLTDDNYLLYYISTCICYISVLNKLYGTIHIIVIIHIKEQSAVQNSSLSHGYNMAINNSTVKGFRTWIHQKILQTT